MEKRKILFLDHTPFIGGAQLSLISHLEKINKNEFKILVGCSTKAKELGLVEEYSKLNIGYFFISFGHLKVFNLLAFFRLVKSVREVRRVIKKEKIDLIFGNTVRADIVGSLATLFSRTKIVWFIQDYTFPKTLFNFLKFIPEKIFYVSHSVAHYYRVKENEKHRVIYIWRNFHEKVAIVPREAISKKRENWGAGKDTVIIGYVGRLVEWKGPQILIEAVEILLKEGFKNIKCIIIGSGKGQEESNEEEVKNLVNNKNLTNDVVFTGFESNIPLSILSLDILCLPSIEAEPFSSVVVEAMMAKIPVIGTNIGGTPEIIKDEQTGLLIPPKDKQALSLAIKRLIVNKELRSRIINKAYNYAINNHTSKYITTKLQKEYLLILKDKKYR